MRTNTIVAFLAGVTAGVVAGILFAPDKGDKTRAKIVSILEEKGISKDKFEDLIAKVKAKINDSTDISDIEVAIDDTIKEEEEA